MELSHPTQIFETEWSGELEPSGMVKAGRGPNPPRATLGKVRMWALTVGPQQRPSQTLVALTGQAQYWLVELACTLHEVENEVLAEARLGLRLTPKPAHAGAGLVYAEELYPQRVTATDDSQELSLKLAPEFTLSAGGVEVGATLGEVGLSRTVERVFPAIQAYGLREAEPYWTFAAHATHPLQGAQKLYALLAAKPPATGLRAKLELVVTMQTLFGPLRFGLPPKLESELAFGLGH